MKPPVNMVHQPDFAEAAEIAELKAHPEVMDVDRLFNREETLIMKHFSNTQELSSARGQLQMILEDQDLPFRFKSFLCTVEDGVIVGAWGLVSVIAWPDAFGFKIL